VHKGIGISLLVVTAGFYRYGPTYYSALVLNFFVLAPIAGLVALPFCKKNRENMFSLLT
jgi:hypothetical protein